MKKLSTVFMTVIAAALLSLVLTSQSYALKIVLTNDDNYETGNVQQLLVALENAGHQVLLSVPCAHQSGKGGSLGSYVTPVPVHSLVADGSGVLSVDDASTDPDGYCVGDFETDKATKSFKTFVDATPIQAALHGIYLANELWGSNPDLVISGPNEGRNTGFAVCISGTLGAAHVAILNDIPAIAVSAGNTPSDKTAAVNYAKLIAQKTLAIVTELETRAKHGKALLSPKTGLTVNLPDAGILTSETKYKFTVVNWLFGSAIVFGNLGEPGGIGALYGYTEYMGYYGLNFLPGQDASLDTDPKSEGNVVKEGYITISTIDATENAPREKAAQAESLLIHLVSERKK
jgi:5'-nucleotidase